METLSANCDDLRTQQNFDTELLGKNLSSPSHEGSPVADRQSRMDTSVELNGSKNDGQQFCLRWNNHQVSFVLSFFDHQSSNYFFFF